MMSSIISRIPKSLLNRTLFHRSLTTETQPQKLERMADQLINHTRIERHDYVILLRHKMGLNRFGSSASAPIAAAEEASGAAAPAAKEKTVFDVKLEKFEASAKLKAIKEIRAFTDLGLKEAKDLVEKVPTVVKKGIAKEEAEKILEKLKAIGATAVLE